MHSLEESLRDALGSELSDLLYRQKAVNLCNETVRLWHIDFQSMSAEDEQNLEYLETAFSNFGGRAATRRSTTQITDLLIDIVAGATAEPLEKLEAYVLLKNHQLLNLQLLRRVLPEVLPDIRLALSPIEHVQTNLERHMHQLQHFMEHDGVAWITGHEAREGLFNRAREALTDLSDKVLSKIAGPADDMDILSVLKSDHRKAELLFKEIDDSKTHDRALTIFRQLKADLAAHSIAEEETVYVRFQDVAGLPDVLNEARQDHADMRILLEDATNLEDDTEHFLDKVDELHQLVQQHVEDEEQEVFKLIRKNSSDELRRDLTRQFLKAKQRLQENLGLDISTSPISSQPEAHA